MRKSEASGVEIRGYFDSSGKESDARVTLAGYLASPATWAEFEDTWHEVLSSFDPPCAYLHLVEANGLRDEFSLGKGWTGEKVSALKRQLVHECFLPAAWTGPDGPSLFKIYCVIESADWEKACKGNPELENEGRATICARYVAEAALRRLPQDPGKSEGHRLGTVELYFDQNEIFQARIESAWNAVLRRPEGRRGPLSMISHVGSAVMKVTPGIQAADFLAWHVNRWRTQACPTSWWQAFKSCPGISAQFSSSFISDWHATGYDGSQLNFES